MSDSASPVLTRGDGDDSRGSRGSGRLNPIAWVADRFRRMVTFVRQVVAELRKVIWPTRQQLLSYTTVVVVFVIVMVAIIFVYDFLFGQAVLTVFGDRNR